MNIRKGDIVRVLYFGLGRAVKGNHFRGQSGRRENMILVKFGRLRRWMWCWPKNIRVVRRGGGR